MYKLFIILFLLCILTSCISHYVSTSNEIAGLSVTAKKINDTYNQITVVGKNNDSALWIKSYIVTYNNKSINLDIKKTLSRKNNSNQYFISFLAPVETEVINLGKKTIIWNK